MQAKSPLVGLLALVLGPSLALASAIPGASLLASQDTLFVPEREDHSPFLVKSPTGAPAIAWVATAPDTNALGRFDELAFAERTGAGWGTPQILAGPSNIFSPEVAYDTTSGRWIAWTEHDGNDSQIKLRYDLGANSQTFELGDPQAPDLESSLCVLESGTAVVVWQGWRNSNYEILMSSGDAVNGFTSPQVISQTGYSDREPEVVVGNGEAWIVWSSYLGLPYNLLCRRFDGTNLTPIVALTTSYRARNLHPQIAWDAANDVLWVASLWVNQGWPGINQHEFPALYDMGSPRLRAFDGTNVYLPAGVDSDQRYPLAPMETFGYTRFNFGGPTFPDRYGEGFALAPLGNGAVEIFHKQSGAFVEFGSSNFYWSVTGTRYGGGTWSAPGEFIETRTSFAFEEPAAVCIADSMWVAWSADRRTPAIVTGILNPNLFGHDANLVIRSVTVDTTAAGPANLTSLGPALAPPTVNPPPRTQFAVEDSAEVRTILWGDNHRHSVDFSWDAYSDPGFRQTVFYSLDWLGHDFLIPSDHAERFSKAVWSFVPRFSLLYDVPERFRMFPGYERAMRVGQGGGDQNAIYRDPADFKEHLADYPENNSWVHMYNVQQGTDVLSIPHTPAQCGAIVKWHALANGNPDSLAAPLRVAEVYQALRKSFEYPGCPDQTTFCTVSPDSGWVNLALALGMKIGLVCASDHTIVAGYIGALSKSMSRDDIWQAIWDRKCYGASQFAQGMNVDFRVAGELMGSEVETYSAPTITFRVQSKSPLQHLEINKNGNPTWFSISSAALDTTVTFTDPDSVVAGTRSFYYLRARDTFGRITYSSPVFVKFTNPPIGTGVAELPSVSRELAVRVFPNPSDGPVEFELRGFGPTDGLVRIHDLGGRLIREIRLSGQGGATLGTGGGSTPAGAADRSEVSSRISWDGRDSSGSRIAAGVYYAVVLAHGQVRSEKFVILR